MEIQITALASLLSSSAAHQLVPYLSTCDLAVVIHSIVTSRLDNLDYCLDDLDYCLDYCNSLYTDLPLVLIQKLQVVQNAAVCLLCGLSPGIKLALNNKEN